MAIENDFLPFATGSGANVETQSTYASDTVVANGFASGVANSSQVNKALRQATIMASMLAQFIIDHSGQPAIDNGTTATLETNLLAAVNAVISTFVANALGAGATAYTPDFQAIATAGVDAGGASVRIQNTNGSYGAMLRNDSTALTILLTSASGATPSYNTLRPFSIQLSTGAVGIDGTGVGTTFGGAISAASANITNALAAATLNITASATIAAATISGALSSASLNVTSSATIASATLTGTPTAPTQAATDNSSKIASTAYVKNQNYLTAANFGASLGANGYSYLPNGLLLQWGTVTVNSATVTNFPIAFPNSCFVITGVDQGNVSTASTNANSISVQAISASQFRAWGKNVSGSFQSTTMSWFAVGN